MRFQTKQCFGLSTGHMVKADGKKCFYFQCVAIAKTYDLKNLLFVLNITLIEANIR